MALTFTAGATTTDGTLQQLWAVTADKHYAAWIFADALVLGDTLQIVVSVYDTQDATYRVYSTNTLTDAQTNPAVFLPYVPTPQHKVQIKMLTGTNRSISWLRCEV